LEYLFNFPFWFAFYYLRRWFEEVWPMLFRLLIWCEERSMEDIVDLPGRGEAQSIGNWGYLGDYLERSISPWCELGGNIAWELEISPF
jgi:hypothetical protein